LLALTFHEQAKTTKIVELSDNTEVQRFPMAREKAISSSLKRKGLIFVYDT